MNTRHIVTDTPLGQLTIVASGEAIAGVYFRNHIRRPAQQTFGRGVPVGGDGLLTDATSQLHEYLAGARREFNLPLGVAGNAFQHEVWGIIAEIPFGQTTTYGAIAERLGDKALAYRVGQAVGANPLCIVVPCHRVLGADGSLTGYAGGLRRKRALLELEEPVRVSAGRLF